jgi:hypothetical protein
MPAAIAPALNPGTAKFSWGGNWSVVIFHFTFDISHFTFGIEIWDDRRYCLNAGMIDAK